MVAPARKFILTLVAALGKLEVGSPSCSTEPDQARANLGERLQLDDDRTFSVSEAVILLRTVIRGDNFSHRDPDSTSGTGGNPGYNLRNGLFNFARVALRPADNCSACSAINKLLRAIVYKIENQRALSVLVHVDVRNRRA